MLSILKWLVWIVATVLIIAVLSQPVGTQAQLAMSLAAMAAMILFWAILPGKTARFVVMAFGSLIVLRYILWRVTSTLPSPSEPLNFSLGLVVLIAELYCVFILFLSLVINADPLRRPPAPVPDPADAPEVDIFVPSYNEDSSVLAMTLSAAVQLDYPRDKLKVWLLDDGGTEQKCTDSDPEKADMARRRRVELQGLCHELGVNYLTREQNLRAKAGNLNNGLAYATGDIVVVLDADHVPFRSFLRETVGLFLEDPRLFLVQTPHAFINPDPIERNLRTFERMPAENEMFYGVTQRGLDKWNGSFFCGSAALLRRTALDEAGGFSGQTITEDCETALELHSRGWNSAYVRRPLIAGLQPDTLADFIGQRWRWCQGMLQILLLKSPIFKSGLKPIQRLSYLSGITFWFFSFPRLIFLIAPLLYIFFDLKIFVATLDETIAYTATYIVINLMIQNYLFGRYRWPFISELYEYIQSVYLWRAVVSVLLSPRKPTFNVTAKGGALDRDYLSSLSLPYFAIYLVLLAGCVTAVWRYVYDPAASNLILVVGLWCFFNLLTAGAALGVCAERRRSEAANSLVVRAPASLSLDGRTIDVAVDRISTAGCTVRLPAAFLPPRIGLRAQRGALAGTMEDGRKATALLPVTLENVARKGDMAVCTLAFGALRPEDYRTVAALMYGDADAMFRFQLRRRRHKNILTGTLQFVWWGLVGPVRAVSYLFKRRKSGVPALVDPGRSPARVDGRDPSRQGLPSYRDETAPQGGPDLIDETEPSQDWVRLASPPEAGHGRRTRRDRATEPY